MSDAFDLGDLQFEWDGPTQPIIHTEPSPKPLTPGSSCYACDGKIGTGAKTLRNRLTLCKWCVHLLNSPVK